MARKKARRKTMTGDEVDAMIDLHNKKQEFLTRVGRLHVVEIRGVDRVGKNIQVVYEVESDVPIKKVRVRLLKPKIT